MLFVGRRLLSRVRASLRRDVGEDALRRAVLRRDRISRLVGSIIILNVAESSVITLDLLVTSDLLHIIGVVLLLLNGLF